MADVLLYLVGLEAANVDPVQWLVNYGLAGIVVALIILGQLRTKSEVVGLMKVADDRAKEIAEVRAELAAKDAALLALMQQMTSHTMPQLAQTAQMVERVARQPHPEVALTQKVEALLAKLDQLPPPEAGEDHA